VADPDADDGLGERPPDQDDDQTRPVRAIDSGAEPTTFSVVVCTYNRAGLLGRTLESVFRQAYPRDRYEILVVNNNSTDRTGEIIGGAAARSPVPFTHLVERRQGLSFARNLGIAHARSEYVAFLDDDAAADPTWLAALDDAITQHGAQVVGGRVEPVFPEGAAPPAWFHDPYVRGFFGVDYRREGQPVRPIRHPLYLMGANIAYARRLFERFGGFNPRLGRKGKRLLAAEETELNRVLERHGIALYYADGAVVRHLIEPDRLTRRDVRRKAYWGGISDALVDALVLGPGAVPKRAKERWSELVRRSRQIVGAPDSPERFGASCRVLYCLGYLAGAAGQYLDRLRGGRPAAPRRPAGAGRLASGGAAPTEYDDLIGRIRKAVEVGVPRGARIAVVSRGDDALLALPGRRAGHFPQAPGGAYAGHHPADSAEAIACLESAHGRGADFLLLPATAAWWLDHYRDLRVHLEARYRLAVDLPDTCLIFDLRTPAERPTAQGGAPVASATGGQRGRLRAV